MGRIVRLGFIWVVEKKFIEQAVPIRISQIERGYCMVKVNIYFLSLIQGLFFKVFKTELGCGKLILLE